MKRVVLLIAAAFFLLTMSATGTTFAQTGPHGSGHSWGETGSSHHHSKKHKKHHKKYKKHRKHHQHYDAHSHSTL